MATKNGRRPEKENGIGPAYEDTIQVENKITFFPRDKEKEFTILMRPHVGFKDRMKDFDLINMFQSYRDPSANLGVNIKDMFSIEGNYEILMNAMDLEDKPLRDRLMNNMTAAGWMLVLQRVISYRQIGDEIYMVEFDEAVKKSSTDPEAAEEVLAT